MKHLPVTVILALICFPATLPLWAEEADAPKEDQAAELAMELANPIASLISVPFQANMDYGMGPTNNGQRFTLNFQPVIPISISKDWNLILRTIVPMIDQKDIVYQDVHIEGQPAQNRSQSGLGDTVQSFFFSPKEPGYGGLIWGVGPVLLYPTATHPFLGSGKWGAGPTAVALVQKNGWTVGALANQIWSTGGEDSRSEISATYLQPFVAYTTN